MITVHVNHTETHCTAVRTGGKRKILSSPTEANLKAATEK